MCHSSIYAKVVYCSNCNVVPLEVGHIDLCNGCVTELINWLAWEDYAAELAWFDFLDSVRIDNFEYNKQFSL